MAVYNNKIKHFKPSLAVMSWNARSIKGKTSIKMNEIQNFLNESKEQIDIICIQENDKPFNLQGYQKAISKTRKGNIQGGGLCIYVKN